MLRKIRLFYPSFSCIWIIYYHSEKCHDCSSLRLVPRLGSDDRGHVGIPKRTKQVTSSPPSYQYEVDLGFPIAAFSASDTFEAPFSFLAITIDPSARECIQFVKSGLRLEIHRGAVRSR